MPAVAAINKLMQKIQKHVVNAIGQPLTTLTSQEQEEMCKLR
jgi:hypothetical protein